MLLSLENRILNTDKLIQTSLDIENGLNKLGDTPYEELVDAEDELNGRGRQEKSSHKSCNK